MLVLNTHAYTNQLIVMVALYPGSSPAEKRGRSLGTSLSYGVVSSTVIYSHVREKCKSN